jgi:hypothetical protein
MSAEFHSDLNVDYGIFLSTYMALHTAVLQQVLRMDERYIVRFCCAPDLAREYKSVSAKSFPGTQIYDGESRIVSITFYVNEHKRSRVELQKTAVVASYLWDLSSRIHDHIFIAYQLEFSRRGNRCRAHTAYIDNFLVMKTRRIPGRHLPFSGSNCGQCPRGE